MLVRIAAPHFCAGFVLDTDQLPPKVSARVPPIIWYMRGWSMARVAAYCTKKGWSWQVFPLKEL